MNTATPAEIDSVLSDLYEREWTARVTIPGRSSVKMRKHKKP